MTAEGGDEMDAGDDGTSWSGATRPSAPRRVSVVDASTPVGRPSRTRSPERADFARVRHSTLCQLPIDEPLSSTVLWAIFGSHHGDQGAGSASHQA